MGQVLILSLDAGHPYRLFTILLGLFVCCYDGYQTRVLINIIYKQLSLAIPCLVNRLFCFSTGLSLISHT